jgi:hypothetical protein
VAFTTFQEHVLLPLTRKFAARFAKQSSTLSIKQESCRNAERISFETRTGEKQTEKGKKYPIRLH